VVTDATCNGVCDGQIQVNVPAGPPIPGTPPYQYSSNNGLTFQPGSLLTGLCAGNIDVVVSDANGCIINGVVVVNEPPALTMAPTFVEPSCFSLSDGSIAFNGAGGTPGYLYSVDNGNTFTPGVTDTVFGIAGGNYDIVIQDANGCETPGTIFVTQPPPFDFVYIANNPSNCGANDGSFEIAAINGQAPYQYSINGPGGPFQGSGFFPNLFSGLYTLYVLDDNGCADSVYEALSDNVMVGFVDIQINNTCYNSCDGLVLVGQQFGSAPYTYTLN